MPNTPKGITYPDDSSPVAVPADIENAAMDVDGLIVPNTGGTYTGSVSFTQSPSVPTPTSGLHAVNKTYADAINTDVTALETELGANPSGTFSTVADRLNTHDHPASSTDNAVARYDGTVGKLQNSSAVLDDNGRLTTPSGASGGYGFVGGAVHLSGTGAPESVVSAPIGSTFLQTDATNDVKGWIRWVKATGTGNTGWVAGPEADTGWRDVATDASGLTGSSITAQIRRTGATVAYRLSFAQSGAASGVTVVSAAGFRGTAPTTYVPIYGNNAGAVVGAAEVGSATVKVYTTASGNGGTVSADVMYSTSDAWPTSLPGSAA